MRFVGQGMWVRKKGTEGWGNWKRKEVIGEPRERQDIAGFLYWKKRTNIRLQSTLYYKK